MESLDKKFFVKPSRKAAENKVRYWRKKLLAERLQAAYFLTLRAYGYDPTRKT